MSKQYSGNAEIDSVLTDANVSVPAVRSWSQESSVGFGVDLTYDWMTQAPAGAPYGGFQPFTADQRDGAVRAMALIAEVADVTFTYDGSGTADLEFGTLSLPTSGNSYTSGLAVTSFTYRGWPRTDSDYVHADIYLTNARAEMLDQSPGSAGFSTMLHEVAHGLGLDHTFENRLPPSGTDSEQYTVMSYSGHPSMRVDPSTYMLYDIAALQYLYGANTSTRAGDDTYTFSQSEPVLMTIWDGGGRDVIDVSDHVQSTAISLEEGTFSSIGPDRFGPAVDNVGIAYGAVIEDAIGGSAADSIIGNSVSNRLEGRGGEDVIFGGDEVGFGDLIVGGAGDDFIHAGGGDDRVYGQEGDDEIFGGDGNDKLVGNAGNDTLHGDDGADRMFGYDGEDVMSGGAGNDYMKGGNQNDAMSGGLGGDLVAGENGADILLGDEGADRVFGGAGGDTLSGGAGNDRVSGGDGNDIVHGDGGNDTVFGGEGNDRLFGDGGQDYIKGGAGDDIISGGASADTLFGGTGSDVFVFSGQWSRDRIRDWESVDTIDFSELNIWAGSQEDTFDSLDIIQSGSSVRVALAGDANNSIVLDNTDFASISSGDFIFLA